MTHNSTMPNTFYEKLSEPTRLAVLDLVDYCNQGLIITRINTPREHRGKGIAHKLLVECCDAADRHNITLWLEVQESDGLTSEQLVAWYKRHGFKGDWAMMQRKPNRNSK